MPHFKTTDNVDLHYKLQGSGEVKVLFITGVATTMGSWKPQMNYFASLLSYQCCYVDNRGVGLSSAPFSAYSSKQMANDTLQLINELKWTSYHLVGLSMGGMISLELTIMDTRIITLTLMVTHAGGLAAYVPISGLSILMNFRPYHSPEEYIEWILPLLYSKKWRVTKYIDEKGKENESN